MEPNFPNQTDNPRGFGGTADPEPELNDDGTIDATEEEQQQYDMLTIRARKMMFGPAKDDVLEMLGSSESPAKAIGQAGSMIMKSLFQSAKASGLEIESDVMIEAGSEIADDLNELGKAEGLFEYDDQESENSEMEEALMWGVKMYGDGMVESGEITPEMMKEAQMQTAEGIESEGGPKAAATTQNQQTPIAQGVSQAVAPQGGLVGGQM